MPNPGPSSGSSTYAPTRTRYRQSGAAIERTDESMGWCPRVSLDRLYDFEGLSTYAAPVPLFTDDTGPNTAVISVTDTKIARGYYVVPKSGILTGVDFVGEDTLAANDTNYVTFAVTNKSKGGAASIAMLAATDANTTKSTGGSAITTNTTRALTLNGTAANLRVLKGDVIRITATTAGTLANVVDVPTAVLKISSFPDPIVDLVDTAATISAGNPLVGPVASASTGVVIAQHANATGSGANAQTLGFYYGDDLSIIPTQQPRCHFRFKVSGVAANVRTVIGLASAYNATLDSTTTLAWFRLEGNSLVLLWETDDGTTDNDDQSTGVTLTADTWYLGCVDLSQPLTARFFLATETASGQVDWNLVGTGAMAALTSAMTLQPVAYQQKDSGTTTGSLSLDYIRPVVARF